MYILFLKGCVFILFQLYGALVPRCRRKLRSCRIGLTDVRPPSLPVATKVRSVESMKWRRWNNQLNPTSSAFCMGNLRRCNGNFIFKDFTRISLKVSPDAFLHSWPKVGIGWGRGAAERGVRGVRQDVKCFFCTYFTYFALFLLLKRHIVFSLIRTSFALFARKSPKCWWELRFHLRPTWTIIV